MAPLHDGGRGRGRRGFGRGRWHRGGQVRRARREIRGRGDGDAPRARFDVIDLVLAALAVFVHDRRTDALSVSIGRARRAEAHTGEASVRTDGAAGLFAAHQARHARQQPSGSSFFSPAPRPKVESARFCERVLPLTDGGDIPTNAPLVHCVSRGPPSRCRRTPSTTRTAMSPFPSFPVWGSTTARARPRTQHLGFVNDIPGPFDNFTNRPRPATARAGKPAARPTSAASTAAPWEKHDPLLGSPRPPAHRPRGPPRAPLRPGAQPAWIAYAGVTLQFSGYFEDLETTVRTGLAAACVITFHLEDATFDIREPRGVNSGIVQGPILRRGRHPGPDGEPSTRPT